MGKHREAVSLADLKLGDIIDAPLVGKVRVIQIITGKGVVVADSRGREVARVWGQAFELIRDKEGWE